MNYTWTASSSGNSGSGTINQPNLTTYVFTGINFGAGDMVTLELEPTNLREIRVAKVKNYRLVKVN